MQNFKVCTEKLCLSSLHFHDFLFFFSSSLPDLDQIALENKGVGELAFGTFSHIFVSFLGKTHTKKFSNLALPSSMKKVKVSNKGFYWVCDFLHLSLYLVGQREPSFSLWKAHQSRYKKAPLLIKLFPNHFIFTANKLYYRPSLEGSRLAILQSILREFSILH